MGLPLCSLLRQLRQVRSQIRRVHHQPQQDRPGQHAQVTQDSQTIHLMQSTSRRNTYLRKTWITVFCTSSAAFNNFCTGIVCTIVICIICRCSPKDWAARAGRAAAAVTTSSVQSGLSDIQLTASCERADTVAESLSQLAPEHCN